MTRSLASTDTPPRERVDPDQRYTPTVTGSFTASPGGLFTVTLAGDIDFTLVPELHDLVERFEAGRSPVATVDLRGVTLFGSTGTNFLVRLQLIARERRGCVTLIGTPPLCLRILKIVGLDTAFELEA